VVRTHRSQQRDVIPRWIGRTLREDDGDDPDDLTGLLHKETASRPHAGAPTARQHTRIGLAAGPRVPVVCMKCNSGWMSDLERAVQPIITPLFLGQVPPGGARLRPEDLRVVSSWATKTALVHDFSNGTPTVTTDETRERFFEIREPPSGGEVWIASYHAPPGFMWKLDECVLAQGELADKDDLALVTISIRHLILQVWIDFRLDGTRPSAYLSLTNNPFLTRI